MNDENARLKSLKLLAENERWLAEHPAQVVHAGDLPLADHLNDTAQVGEQQQ